MSKSPMGRGSGPVRRDGARTSVDYSEDPSLRRAGWGGVARRGAGRLRRDERIRNEEGPGSGDRRSTDPDARPPTDARTTASVRKAADAAVARGGSTTPGGGRGRRKADGARRGSLTDAVGERRAARARQRLEEAAEAFLGDRFADARRILAPLASSAPDVPEVRELHGLILYREGKWEPARRELEAFYALTRDVTQHPVLMDCERALGNLNAVDELWVELGEISPDAATMAEGRIVAAGALADRGDLGAAVATLRKGFKRPARPMEHHLRRAYALADLLERAGDHVAGRELFVWVASQEPEFGDVQDRIASVQ